MIPIFFITINHLDLHIQFVHANSDRIFVYVSNGGDGNIAVLKLNPETGGLKMMEKVPAGHKVMHMALSPDHRFLYASIRSEPFSVISYSIDSDTGKLTYLSKALLPDNMVYISVDQTGRFLFSVSYSGEKIAVNPIKSNGLVQTEAIQVIPTSSNPHSILIDPSNQFVYVPHLGNDQIKQFLFNDTTGLLTINDPEVIYTKDGSGPRHFVFSPNNNFLYVSNELDGTVYTYEINKNTGILTEIQRISVFPDRIINNEPPSENEKKNIKVADIRITPDGKWLYVSERSSNTITAYSVDLKSGILRFIGIYDTEKFPRAINIDPHGNFLIAAGQKSGYISIYEINQKSGELKLLEHFKSGKNPNWIEISEFN